MGININGYALINSAGLKFGASNTKVIAADYGICDPMLPAMNGAATDGSGAYNVYPYPVNSVSWSLGWNPVTYMFTAPVAGIYYTSFGGIVGNGTGTVGQYVGVIVNGALWNFSYTSHNGAWELHHVELMVKVAAGDTISWAMNAAPAPSTGSVSGAYRAHHNMCTIWLVG